MRRICPFLGRQYRFPELFSFELLTKQPGLITTLFLARLIAAKGNAMESEKATYWITLGVLALATTSGFISEHKAWGRGLVDRSIAMVSQISGMATNYDGIVSVVLDRGEDDWARSSAGVAKVEARLACAHRTLIRRQADMARLQAMKVRVRMVNRVPRTVVLPNQNLVIEIPQVRVPSVDTF